MNTNIIITNVKEEAKYKGAYARIFRILNEGSIFCERYEADSSVGYENGVYYLEVEGTIDPSEYERISSIKNVTIID